jgi:serine/threonine protein phosphatase PrpC
MSAEAERKPDRFTDEQRAVAADSTHVLTRCVDGRPDLLIDTTVTSLESEDLFLLCSDGLWGCVEARTLAAILVASSEPEEACTRLIGAAWTGGGLDNIAAAVVHARPQVAVLSNEPRPEQRV